MVLMIFRSFSNIVRLCQLFEFFLWFNIFWTSTISPSSSPPLKLDSIMTFNLCLGIKSWDYLTKYIFQFIVFVTIYSYIYYWILYLVYQEDPLFLLTSRSLSSCIGRFLSWVWFWITCCSLIFFNAEGWDEYSRSLICIKREFNKQSAFLIKTSNYRVLYQTLRNRERIPLLNVFCIYNLLTQN